MKLNTSTNYLELFHDNFQLTKRKSIRVKFPEKEGMLLQKEFPIQMSGNNVTALLEGFANYNESISVVDDNTLVADITVEVMTDSPFIIQCPFITQKTDKFPYYMIPGFLYGSNNLKGSDGAQPKFDYAGEIEWPNSSKFYIRSDRSSNSSVIRVSDGHVFMIAIDHCVIGVEVPQKDKWAPAWLYTGLMLDSSDKQLDETGFQIGYENSPQRYSWIKDDVPSGDQYLCGFIENMKGKTLKIRTAYFADKANGIPDYGKALRKYYQLWHTAPKPAGTRMNALEGIGKSIMKDGYNKESKIFVLTDHPDGRNIGDIAWTGGMQVGWPLMVAGNKLKNLEMMNTSVEFINAMCENAMNSKAGLLNEEFRDGKWQVTGWWGTREDCFNWGDKPLHSAYLNGQCSYYLLKAYLFIGKQHQKWFDTAKTILDTVIKSQTTEGALAIFFNPENGHAVDYDGFQSCWFVPGIALLYALTRDEKYLQAAEKAIDYYYKWHERGELYNTPMDTHKAVDQEGNISFVAACRELHAITNNPKYIDYAFVGFNWEFSWKFGYNTVYSNDPLRRLNWSTCGGSITSTHNPSIHQMGNLMAGDMYYFYNQTKDEYLKSRLKDTCLWGLSAYNVYDGYLGYGTVGMATEQFTYTDGVVLPWPHPWDGGLWEANLPWASACVLLSVAENIPDEFFEV